MKRVLAFDGPKAAKRFELIRVAVLAAGDGKGERNRAAIRAEARLLDALDGVSDNALERWKANGSDEHLAGPDVDKDARVLKTEGGTVTLSQEDHDVLSKYVDATPWLPRASRDAVDVQDWLSAAEKIE